MSLHKEALGLVYEQILATKYRAEILGKSSFLFFFYNSVPQHLVFEAVFAGFLAQFASIILSHIAKV